MCIRNDGEKVAKLRQRMTVLRLWKVVEQDNSVGIWADTREYEENFHVGENTATDYIRRGDYLRQPGAFHCTFTRKAARRYRTHRWARHLKIIKVYAETANIVSAGRDEYADIDSISVSKMEIKSLQHQR